MNSHAGQHIARGCYDWIVIDLVTNHEGKYKEDEELLDMLACAPEMPVAAIDADQIEMLAQLCQKRWADQKAIENLDEVERVCALYLCSDKVKHGPEKMLRSAVEPT